jgi:hypothetical protein
MPERRNKQRWPAYLKGLIVFDGRASTAECLVRNTSEGGARLVLGEVALLPDEFSLRIPHRQTELRVRTRWRQLRQVGVEAVPEEKPTAADDALRRQLKQLETHNAELVRRVAKLSEPST